MPPRSAHLEPVSARDFCRRADQFLKGSARFRTTAGKLLAKSEERLRAADESLHLLRRNPREFFTRAPVRAACAASACCF